MVPVKLRNRPKEQLFLGGLSHFLLFFLEVAQSYAGREFVTEKCVKLVQLFWKTRQKKGIRAHDRLETNIIRALHHLKFDKSLSFLSVDLTL